MKTRIAKKLLKESSQWTFDSKVRHRRKTFIAAWKVELRALRRGDRWPLRATFRCA